MFSFRKLFNSTICNVVRKQFLHYDGDAICLIEKSQGTKGYKCKKPCHPYGHTSMPNLLENSGYGINSVEQYSRPQKTKSGFESENDMQLCVQDGMKVYGEEAMAFLNDERIPLNLRLRYAKTFELSPHLQQKLRMNYWNDGIPIGEFDWVEYATMVLVRPLDNFDDRVKLLTIIPKVLNSIYVYIQLTIF